MSTTPFIHFEVLLAVNRNKPAAPFYIKAPTQALLSWSVPRLKHCLEKLYYIEHDNWCNALIILINSNNYQI